MNTLLVSLALTAPSFGQQIEVIPPPQGVVPPPPIIVVEKIPTLDEFQKWFVPVPGIHEATIIHPVSKKPVCVHFSLPPGCPKVDRCCNRLTFDYGKCEVKLIFRILGRVDVRYID
jgi:hypothetical protein